MSYAASLPFADIELRPAYPSELVDVYQMITDDEEWTQFNGPYFGYERPTLRDFQLGHFTHLCMGEGCLLITKDDKPIGTVSFYWENEPTRWLEVGIIIYRSDMWAKGIGFKALVPWITHMFATKEIARVGLTTWSGNPRMMACAEKLGMKQEARLRKVRYFNGVYYDSVKYGVLREEWFENLPKLCDVVKADYHKLDIDIPSANQVPVNEREEKSGSNTH